MNCSSVPAGNAPKGALWDSSRESKRRLSATGSVTAAWRGSAKLNGPTSSRPATGPGQAQRVLAMELVHEVGLAVAVGGDGAGGQPGGVGDLELVPPLELDVEVVGIAAVLEGVVVQRRPVVGRAAQEQRGGAQRRAVVAPSGGPPSLTGQDSVCR